MYKLIIIRGPLGVGKTTVSRILAHKLDVPHISVDKVLDDHNLGTTDGIPLEDFIKANDIIVDMIRSSNQTAAVIDGNFYYQEQINDLRKKCENNVYMFTLITDLDTCIQRDAQRPYSHGEDSARFVYNLTTPIHAGYEIDTTDLTAEETVKKILEKIN